MSIIYEALLKTQEKRAAEVQQDENQVEQKRPDRVRFKKILFILFAILLISLIIAGIFVGTKKAIAIYYQRHQVLAQPSLTLEGVFLSDGESVALINQHLFHLGDAIGQYRIVSMDMNGVLLQNGGQRLFLAEKTDI